MNSMIYYPVKLFDTGGRSTTDGEGNSMEIMEAIIVALRKTGWELLGEGMRDWRIFGQVGLCHDDHDYRLLVHNEDEDGNDYLWLVPEDSNEWFWNPEALQYFPGRCKDCALYQHESCEFWQGFDYEVRIEDCADFTTEVDE